GGSWMGFGGKAPQGTRERGELLYLGFFGGRAGSGPGPPRGTAERGLGFTLQEKRTVLFPSISYDRSTRTGGVYRNFMQSVDFVTSPAVLQGAHFPWTWSEKETGETEAGGLSVSPVFFRTGGRFISSGGRLFCYRSLLPWGGEVARSDRKRNIPK